MLVIWGSYYNMPKPYSIYSRGTVGVRFFGEQVLHLLFSGRLLAKGMLKRVCGDILLKRIVVPKAEILNPIA